eukprot:SAG25_NODE_485_length_7477_cov_6.546761_6_plen_64_part_00
MGRRHDNGNFILDAAGHTAVASYRAAPPRHEALDGCRRGVESVMHEYIDNTLYCTPHCLTSTH